MGAEGASAFAEVAAFGTIASGEVVATGARAGASVGMMGAGFRRIIDGASEKGDGEALLGDRCVTVGGNVLLMFAGTYCGKDFT